MKALRRFVIAGDNHGDEIHEGLSQCFFDWLTDFKPHIRKHSGDLFNFAALRRKATPDDKATAIAPDYKAGTDFLKRFFDGGDRRVFLRGNHDERMYNLAQTTTDATLAHYASKMVTEVGTLVAGLRATMKPYDAKEGVCDVEGVRTIHGYASGIGSARKFAFVYGTCAFGHTHAMDLCPVERWPEVAIAHGTGCLCQIDQPYNATQMNKLRHENGWLYGYTDGTRATYLQARFKDGRVIASDAFKAY